MLVDTGCTRTIVESTVVWKSKVTPKNKVPILCVHGDTCLYPTARVKLMCGNWEKETEIAVAPNLPVAVLLGSDIHSLVPDKPTANVATIDAQSAGAELPNVSSGLIAVTRSQFKRKVEQTEAEPSAKPRDATGESTAEEEPIREEAVDNLDMTEFPYWGEEEVPVQETWENTEMPSSDTSAVVSVTNHMEGSHDEIEVLNATPDILKTWQQEDESLEKIRKFADGTTMEDPESSVKFLRKEGVLYRLWKPPKRPAEFSEYEQLVLPTKCRKIVLGLAHEVAMAGHLGITKTKDQVLQRYYWPGVFSDIAKYCRSCEVCQRDNSRRPGKVAMVSMPLISCPFE